ncbi:MAG: hypothetical protein CBE21_09515 [Proteobacteria bacterium TMED261]|nr:MAG: hypothetical protein CBE21_09515 [Proteobacteria bacterium TMED261]
MTELAEIIPEKVKVPCPKIIVPNSDELENIIIELGNKYGWEYLQPIEEILGAFPLSHTWNKELDIPELEWEGKIQAIVDEYKIFPIIKICEKLGVSLELTVPPFGIKVDVGKLVSDPEYKTELFEELREIVSLDGLLDDFTAEGWNGDLGIDIPDIKLSKAWDEMISEIQSMLETGMFSKIGELLDAEPLKTLIETLPDPIGFLLELVASVPKGGYKFDSDKLFKELREKAEEAGEDVKNSFLEYEIPFVSEVPDILGLGDVLPKTLGDLIDLDKTREVKNIDFPRWEEEKLFKKFKHFIQNLPQVLLEACLEKLTALIEPLIPPEIPIPFDLCVFLQAIGFPKEISVSSATS